MAGVTEFQFNALADQLRLLKLRQAQLERRLSVGDIIQWPAAIDTSPTGSTVDVPDHTVEGYYVRLGSLLIAWITINWDEAGNFATLDDIVVVNTPYEISDIVAGGWNTRVGSWTLEGPLRAHTASSVHLVIPSGNGLTYKMSTQGIFLPDLETSISTGAEVTLQLPWTASSSVDAWMVAILPRGA